MPESPDRKGGHLRRKAYPEYSVWEGMIERCLNPNWPYFRSYGGRGISVHQSWKKFENFYADMGPRPSREHSLDRIDNNGNYEPGNCRWATREEQQRNTRANRVLSLNGKSQCLTAWAEELGVKKRSLASRLCYGWSQEMALTVPFKRRIKQNQ